MQQDFNTNHQYMKTLHLQGVVLIVGLFFIGCKQNKDQENKNNPISQTHTTLQQSAIQINSMMKLSIKEANDQYGEPFETDKFNIKNGVPEFRMKLYNSFEENKSIDVFEATWHKSDTTNLTLWYIKKGKKWLPVDYYEWNKGLEF